MHFHLQCRMCNVCGSRFINTPRVGNLSGFSCTSCPVRPTSRPPFRTTSSQYRNPSGRSRVVDSRSRVVESPLQANRMTNAKNSDADPFPTFALMDSEDSEDLFMALKTIILQAPIDYPLGKFQMSTDVSTEFLRRWRRVSELSQWKTPPPWMFHVYHMFRDQNVWPYPPRFNIKDILSPPELPRTHSSLARSLPFVAHEVLRPDVTRVFHLANVQPLWLVWRQGGSLCVDQGSIRWLGTVLLICPSRSFIARAYSRQERFPDYRQRSHDNDPWSPFCNTEATATHVIPISR